GSDTPDPEIQPPSAGPMPAVSGFVSAQINNLRRVSTPLRNARLPAAPPLLRSTRYGKDSDTCFRQRKTVRNMPINRCTESSALSPSIYAIGNRILHNRLLWKATNLLPP